MCCKTVLTTCFLYFVVLQTLIRLLVVVVFHTCFVPLLTALANTLMFVLNSLFY